MRFSTRQFVLVLAVLAAWQLLGGDGRARADYVSATCLSRGNDVPSIFLFGSRSWETEGGAAGASNVRTGEKDSDEWEGNGSRNSMPLTKLFPMSWRMANNGAAGTSSGSGFGSGPSSQYAGNTTCLDFPLIEVVALIPPQGDIVHPLSVASFLFRPPRPIP